MKQSISAAAFARLINKDPKTVTNWIKKGLLPSASKIGGQYHIPLKEVEAFSSSTVYPPPKQQTSNEKLW